MDERRRPDPDCPYCMGRGAILTSGLADFPGDHRIVTMYALPCRCMNPAPEDVAPTGDRII